MKDDPIRAALNAAALSVAAEQCDRVADVFLYECIAGRACTCRNNAAAAIAAFLRALGGVATVPYLNPMTTRELAAVVERAAREAGDEG